MLNFYAAPCRIVGDSRSDSQERYALGLVRADICPNSMDAIPVELFGPGVITEAADDDPSGLARYFVAGGAFMPLRFSKSAKSIARPVQFRPDEPLL
jgi:hypothetical protein